MRRCRRHGPASPRSQADLHALVTEAWHRVGGATGERGFFCRRRPCPRISRTGGVSRWVPDDGHAPRTITADNECPSSVWGLALRALCGCHFSCGPSRGARPDRQRPSRSESAVSPSVSFRCSGDGRGNWKPRTCPVGQPRLRPRLRRRAFARPSGTTARAGLLRAVPRLIRGWPQSPAAPTRRCCGPRPKRPGPSTWP